MEDLDLNVAAEFHLCRTLARIKSIATAPGFPADVLAKGNGPSPFQGSPGSAAAANVTARLYNSNPVKDVIPAVTEKVRAVLGVAKVEPPSKQGDGKGDVEVKGRSGNPVSASVALGSGDDMSLASATGPGDLERYTSRLAEKSSEGSANEHDSDMDFKDSLEDSRVLQAEIGEPSVKHNDDSISTSPPLVQYPTTKKKKSRDLSPIRTSTFLPSLAMGGYWSGSESAPNTSDEEAAKIKPRKNRRGQQARRAVWEKKYGSGANHVKQQKNSRDEGWDPRRGAQSEETKGRSKGRSSMRSRARGQAKQEGPTGANSDPLGKSTRKPTVSVDKLHPSWEAAQRRRKDAKNTATFQGKKVVFD